MEHIPIEGAWRRGWSDTKTAWKSLPFVILDAVACVVVGSVFEWYWGLGLFVFAMFCVWIGVTASAPVRQRNEAWSVLLKKQKPMSNKEDLLRAISTFRESAIMEFTQKDVMNEHSCKTCPLMEPSDFTQAYKALSAEKLVAGEKADKIVSQFMTSVLEQMVAQYSDEPPLVGVLGTDDFIDKLSRMTKKTLKRIESLTR